MTRVMMDAAVLERLAQEPYTKIWLDGYDRARRPRKLRDLARFQAWLLFKNGKEPRTLIVEARTDISIGPENVKLVLREYSNHLIDQGEAPTSAFQYNSVLRSYFTSNGVNLGRFLKTPVGPTWKGPMPLSQQRVIDMIKSRSDPMEKFVIAFFAQTGQRLRILTAMKREMMDKKVMRGYGIISVPATFPDHRGQNVNRLKREYTFIAGRDTMKLLHELDKVSHYDGGWLLDISQREMGRIVDEAAQAIGIQKKPPTRMKKSWSEVSPNILRDYTRDSMRAAKIDACAMLHMLGSKVPTVFGIYNPPDEELLEAYEQAESKLSLSGDQEADPS